MTSRLRRTSLVKGAFTSAGFDSSSDWRFKTHLANLPLYYEFKDDNVTEAAGHHQGHLSAGV